MDRKIVKGSFHSQKKPTSPKHNDHDYMVEKDVEVTTYPYKADLKRLDVKEYGISMDFVDCLGTLEIRKNELKNKCNEDELAFYNQAFGKCLELQNERHKQARNYKRIKNMDQWRKLPNYCPSEDIFQIGNTDCFPGDRTLLKQCVLELMEWEKEKLGKNYIPITLVGHYDESTPHYHKRGVYVVWDDDGNPFPCMKDALKQAGIPLPDPSKPESKNNNRKKTYDTMRREAWLDIIEKHLPKDFILDRTVDKDREFGHMEVDIYKAYKKAETELEIEKDEVRKQKNENDIIKDSLLKKEREILDIFESLCEIQEAQGKLIEYGKLYEREHQYDTARRETPFSDVYEKYQQLHGNVNDLSFKL